jgi:hypothetical protein
MRASKLITISTVAVLMGGTSLAVGHSLQSGQSQSRTSMQGAAGMSQGNVRGSETRGLNAQAAEQGSKIKSSRELRRGQAMTTQRARAITGVRGQAMIERGQQASGQGVQRAAQLGSPARRSFAPTGRPVYARATPSEARVGLTTEQRARLHEMARRELPRASYLPEVRVNAVVPRNVQLAPVPEELARHYPRFRRDQAFMYRDQIVLVNPATSRIVAVLPA